jgi:transcriptional regulator with XRE-family HTH domain
MSSKNAEATQKKAPEAEVAANIDVAQQMKRLRIERGLSLRALAEGSGLSVNTLSLIENGKTSPSVSTLQRVAVTLRVPITAFFKPAAEARRVVFMKSDQRLRAEFEHGNLEDLGWNFANRAVQPFVINLQPHSGSGPDPIVHTGYEFVYCLAGCIHYTVAGTRYVLEPGDSLLFESHLPHRWENCSEQPSKALLVLCPTDVHDAPSEQHFSHVQVTAKGE